MVKKFKTKNLNTNEGYVCPKLQNFMPTYTNEFAVLHDAYMTSINTYMIAIIS